MLPPHLVLLFKGVVERLLNDFAIHQLTQQQARIIAGEVCLWRAPFGLDTETARG